MPKARRDRSVSFDRSRASPFPCGTSRARGSSPKKPLGSEEDIKEWEEARCPVCMEHPHNAVLLKCSSHEKGCRPYMCDTSYRHSNCLDLFRKSSTEASETTPPEEEVRTSEASVINLREELGQDRADEELLTSLNVSCEKKVQPKLVCPLCRGHVEEWIVVRPARHFMNAKSRSCACENCNFCGTYMDLRKHARLEHPLVRPSVADPERERSWRRLERQRDLGDLLSTLQSSVQEEGVDDESVMHMGDGLLTVFFLIRVFRPGLSSRSSSWSGSSRARAQLSVRRRSTRLWGESYDGETGSSSRDLNNEASDSESAPLRIRRRVRRRTTPENEP